MSTGRPLEYALGDARRRIDPGYTGQCTVTPEYARGVFEMLADMYRTESPTRARDLFRAALALGSPAFPHRSHRPIPQSDLPAPWESPETRKRIGPEAYAICPDCGSAPGIDETPHEPDCPRA